MACFGAIALAQEYLGPELDCFPELVEWFVPRLLPGLVGFLVALVLGVILAIGPLRGKVAPRFGRFAGLCGAMLVFVLLATPIFGDPIRLLSGSGTHGPVCSPRGWLGEKDPEAWKRLSKRLGHGGHHGHDHY